MKRNHALKPLAGIVSAALLAACAAQQSQPPATGAEEGGRPAAAAASVSQGTVAAPAVREEPAPAGREEPPPEKLHAVVRPGTGVFLGTRGPAEAEPVAAAGDITLNFERADLQEVARVILGDLLGVNYVIDPEVSGTVSIQTSRPVSRDALLPMIESMFRVSGAAVIRQGDLYRVVPMAKAAGSRAPVQVGRQRLHAGAGYQVQVVPLRYIAASEMQKILEPFVGETGILRVDERRNLIILAGSSLDVRGWLDTVDLFDVDWLKGYSVGIFPLENADPKTVAGELGQILGEGVGDGGTIVRVEPMERLNALLVVTPQASYLTEVEQWIGRLDQAAVGPGARMHVYRVRNRKARELASILSEMISGGPSRRAEAPVRVAPGLTPVSLATAEGEVPETPPVDVPPPGGGAPEGDVGMLSGTDVRVVADEQNNSVLVMATAGEYLVVEQALKQLDVLPLQVLVEASIVEVTLEDELS